MFTREELLQLRPEHIRDFLSFKASGKVRVNWNDESKEKLGQFRSSSMIFTKNALSFFMPNNLPCWCNNEGNPTKSRIVCDLIERVKRIEARGAGEKCNTNRLLTQDIALDLASTTRLTWSKNVGEDE